MKIIIKRPKRIGFRIILPTWILTRKAFMRSIIDKQLELEITEEDLTNIQKAIKQCKKHFGKLELVSVESADGNIVKIYL